MAEPIFCRDASSVPRSEWMKRGVDCSNKTCSELFIYAGEGDFQKGRENTRTCYGGLAWINFHVTKLFLASVWA